jgi:hypothetical protein
VNYVIFGVMCKLCLNHFNAIGDRSAASDFAEAEMLSLISKYKGSGFTGLGTPSGNFVPSKEWAVAGHRDWPKVASPKGDRSNCTPTCRRTDKLKSSFKVQWVRGASRLDPVGPVHHITQIGRSGGGTAMRLPRGSPGRDQTTPAAVCV